MAPIATAITASLAIAFVSLRVYEAYVRQEWQWADSCAVVALVSSPFPTLQTGLGSAKGLRDLDVVDSHGRVRILQ